MEDVGLLGRRMLDAGFEPERSSSHSEKSIRMGRPSSRIGEYTSPGAAATRRAVSSQTMLFLRPYEVDDCFAPHCHFMHAYGL